MNILIVGAHPDDYEIGLAGTIKKHTSRGHKVIAVIMSNGEAISSGIKREAEAKEAAKILGIEEVHFFHFQDTMIPSGAESIRRICEIIDTREINRIYTHSLNDTHQDHRNTCLAVLSAGKKVEQILFFESPSAVSLFKPALFVDISNYLEDKIKSLSVYNSIIELKKDYINPELIKCNALFRGKQGNVNFAEGFEVYKFIEK